MCVRVIYSSPTIAMQLTDSYLYMEILAIVKSWIMKIEKSSDIKFKKYNRNACFFYSQLYMNFIKNFYCRLIIKWLTSSGRKLKKFTSTKFFIKKKINSNENVIFLVQLSINNSIIH